MTQWLRPGVLLRVEGATLLALAAWLYAQSGGQGWLFAVLLLAPDLAMLGYLAGKGPGAAVYNLFHTYPLPAALAAYGLLAGAPLATHLALIWFAHLGMDRLMGYGLKYATDFKDTHLARV